MWYALCLWDSIVRSRKASFIVNGNNTMVPFWSRAPASVTIWGGLFSVLLAPVLRGNQFGRGVLFIPGWSPKSASHPGRCMSLLDPRDVGPGGRSSWSSWSWWCSDHSLESFADISKHYASILVLRLTGRRWSPFISSFLTVPWTAIFQSLRCLP